MGKLQGAEDVSGRLDSLTIRVGALEDWMEGFKFQMTDVGNEVKANTRLTEAIQGSVEDLKEDHRSLKGDVASVKGDVAAVKGDTADIVSATKWLSTSKRLFVAGCVAAGAFCTAAIGVLKLAHMLGLIG